RLAAGRRSGGVDCRARTDHYDYGRSLRSPSRLFNRRGDGRVAAAAADVAIHPMGDLVVARRGGFQLQQQALGGHDLAGGAVAALGADVADKRLLKWVEL